MASDCVRAWRGVALDRTNSDGARGSFLPLALIALPHVRRRSTEVMYLTGEIARLGRVHGIPTPVNDALVQLVLQVEKDRLGRERKGMTGAEMMAAVGLSC